jgi:hypothetical protein
VGDQKHVGVDEAFEVFADDQVSCGGSVSTRYRDRGSYWYLSEAMSICEIRRIGVSELELIEP